jgi:hypothetical protein
MNPGSIREGLVASQGTTPGDLMNPGSIQEGLVASQGTTREDLKDLRPRREIRASPEPETARQAISPLSLIGQKIHRRPGEAIPNAEALGRKDPKTKRDVPRRRVEKASVADSAIDIGISRTTPRPDPQGSVIRASLRLAERERGFLIES